MAAKKTKTKSARKPAAKKAPKAAKKRSAKRRAKKAAKRAGAAPRRFLGSAVIGERIGRYYGGASFTPADDAGEDDWSDNPPPGAKKKK